MRLPIKLLNDALDRIEAKRRARLARAGGRYSKYEADPCGYAADVLKVQWWAKQQEIARALLQPPHRVLVRASHSVGKSHLLGGLVNWWYDTHDPGVVLTSAPTARQVRDVLWKEVRRQRGTRGGFPGPKIPRLESSPTHFAHGFTANDATSFQGQHEAAVLVIFDEAVGVDRELWEGADSMVQGVKFGFVAVCNPTKTASEFYMREQRGGCPVVRISTLDHPNIAAELANLPPPYPQAVRLGWLKDRIEEWCTPVTGAPLPTDIAWPPGSGKWVRPGPLAESRLFGLWPSASTGVWTDALWASAERCGQAAPPLRWSDDDLPEIGCDVARFGDDNTEIHVRRGPCSTAHESHNGWPTDQTAGRLKQLARELAARVTDERSPSAKPVDPKSIPIKIDDDGVGGGVVDQADGYNFIAVSSAGTASEPDDYPNVRCELWFSTAGRARSGRLDLSRLDKKVRQELKRQAMSPEYKLDAAGRRVVTPKDKTKKELGRSPDGMDSVNLAYYEAPTSGTAKWVGGDQKRRNWRDRHG